MASGTVHSSYVGMFDITPDHHPIIDELAQIGLPDVFCCVGLSGHGFKLAPAFGLMNSEIISGKHGSERTFDWSYFSLSRFESNNLFKSSYENLPVVA